MIPNKKDSFAGCVLCGAELEYLKSSAPLKCEVCGKEKTANARCKNGHFVCDECHSCGVLAGVIKYLRFSKETSPIKLFEKAVTLPGVHMHGPEHHSIVPMVLLVCYKNCGGKIDLDAALKDAYRRGKQVPGGTCGYWGVCGSAAGAGIFASIITLSSPLNGAAWAKPMSLTAQCITTLAQYGGPRCCKRTSRLCIENAIDFTAKLTGVKMPKDRVSCTYMAKNKECIGNKCPYFPDKSEKGETKKWNFSLKVKK